MSKTQYSKIEFKNEPDETTPISAENLNQLQTNIENGFREKYDYNATIVNDANSITDAGIYMIQSGASNFPFDVSEVVSSGNLAWLIVLSSNSTSITPITQIAFESESYDFFLRKSNNDGWEEWEKKLSKLIINAEENPTNIYSNGKQVYVKRFTGIGLPEAKTIPTNIDGEISLYKLEGVATNNSNYVPIQYAADARGISCYYMKGSSSIYIESGTNRDNYSYYIDFYYTYDD